jgi:hypothetical protein
MPCQVRAQSVVAISRPPVQGSEIFGCVAVAAGAFCANAGEEGKKGTAEKKRTAAARTKFAVFAFPRR